MLVDVRSFVKDHHAFYEVAPYYVLLHERKLDVTVMRKVHAGFDVDVYGVGPEDPGLAMPRRDEYALAYAVLRTLVADVSREYDDVCSLEIIAYPASVVLESRGYGKVKARLRIRVSHWGLDQPAGMPEQQALEKLKTRLEALGVAPVR
jgi:hypothetical protein